MAFRTNKTPVLQEKSASGSVATFNTALAMPLPSCKIAVSGYQEGTGTPSPDNVRPISGWSAIHIGSDAKYAGFINFNQLVKNGNFADTSNWFSRNGSLITASNNTLDITPVSNGLQVVTIPIPINSNHRYLFMVQLKADSTSVLFGMQNNDVHARIQSNGNGMWQQCVGLLNNNNMNDDRSTVVVVFDDRTSDWTTTQLRNVIIVDLTQMFGSTKADEIYNMEQQTAGSGVAYVRSLFPNDYYAYNTGTITTVSAVNGSTNSFFTIPIGQTVNEATYNAKTGELEVTQPSVQTLQLPPCPIDTLVGVNNIWADTGDVDLTYKDLDIAKRGNFREVFKLPS